MCELALVGCDRVIITGSSEELTFESGAGGLSPYAATKTAIGIYSRLFSANYGLPVVTARLFHVFGPGQREDKLIPYVIRSFASGMQPRLGACRRICDLVFVEDVVEALVCLVQKPTIPGGQLDIGTGVGSTLRDVVLGIKCMMDSNIEPVFATRTEDSRCPQIANSPRTTELLGWTAKTLVPDGLVKTIKYERHAMATLASAHRGI
jgi:nucleoside-diphosphate-sugar epimerase